MEPFVVTTIVLASILLLVGVGYIIIAVKLKTIRQKKKAKEVKEIKAEPEPVQPVLEETNLCDMIDKYSKSASKDFQRNEKTCRKAIKDLEAKVHARDKDILEIMEAFCKLDNMTHINSGQSLKTKNKITDFLEAICSRRFSNKKLFAFVSGECYMKIHGEGTLPGGQLKDIYVDIKLNSYQKNKIDIKYDHNFDSEAFMYLFPSYVELLENIIYEGIDLLKQELYNFITKKLKKEG